VLSGNFHQNFNIPDTNDTLVLQPGNFSHHNDKKAAAIKIVETFQDQIKKNGSDARIKMFGDIPFATGWWSWLFR
jgi:hypothetical protein